MATKAARPLPPLSPPPANPLTLPPPCPTPQACGVRCPSNGEFKAIIGADTLFPESGGQPLPQEDQDFIWHVSGRACACFVYITVLFWALLGAWWRVSGWGARCGCVASGQPAGKLERAPRSRGLRSNPCSARASNSHPAPPPRRPPQVSRALSQAFDVVMLQAAKQEASKSAKEPMDALRKAIQELYAPPVDPEAAAAAAGARGWQDMT